MSARDGTADESVVLNTWTNAGDFYVRVRGRNGAFDRTQPFDLTVTRLTGVCGQVDPLGLLPASTVSPLPGAYRTLIVTDLSEIQDPNGQLSTMTAALNTLANRPEVEGVVIDLAALNDPRINAARAQSDLFTDCPYAQNILAQTIKEVLETYQAVSTVPTEYIVIAGNDQVIPFYRYPDPSPLATESEYDIPVLNGTISRSSLQLDYVLGQDEYGSTRVVNLQGSRMPIPKLAVGRLVENPEEIANVINSYLQTVDGVFQPTSAYVTGYGFLTDGSEAVVQELTDGMLPNSPIDTLISAADVTPDDPAAWTGDQLAADFLNNRYDITYLAGHFSHYTALAADYTTRISTDDLVASNIDFTNALIFSNGCHSGYNMVNPHAGIVEELDWAQAFAQKGAYLIAGTGYQYGDADLTEYSERLYLDFTQELRRQGPVPIGNALVAAKQSYLSDTGVEIDGVFEKTILVSTLFGLPMFSLDLGGAPGTSVTLPPISTTTTPVANGPGTAFNLETSDVTLDPVTTLLTKTLTTPDNANSFTTTFFEGADGFTSRLGFPIKPLEIYNAGHPNGIDDGVLRGVGFRRGSYEDFLNRIPLTSVAATELATPHLVFRSDYFFPIQPWTVNHYGVLIDPENGFSRLMLSPVQYRSNNANSIQGTMRVYDSFDFRLYYSNYIGSEALAAPPSIAKVLSRNSSPGVVDFSVFVTDPIAGVQEVWVTYTFEDGGATGSWQSVDLVQDPNEPTIWRGSLTGLTNSGDLRFMAQAVNGIGLVTMSSNYGEYFVVNVDPAEPTADLENPDAPPPAATQLSLVTPPIIGEFATSVDVTAELTSNGSPVAGEMVEFTLGGSNLEEVTDANGQATVTFVLLADAGDYELQVAYTGTPDFDTAIDSTPFAINKQPTTLTTTDPSFTFVFGQPWEIPVTLVDGENRVIPERSLVFVTSGPNGIQYSTDITDYTGQVLITAENTQPEVGTYTVEVYFSGDIPTPNGILTLEDPNFEPSTLTFNVEVEAINSAPEINDDTVTVDEDQSVTFDVSANDSDVDGNLDLDSLTITNNVDFGELVDLGSGTFAYTPTLNFNGQDIFYYNVCDSGQDKDPVTDADDLCDKAMVTIVVNPVNDAPEINAAETLSVTEGMQTFINLLDIVTDVETPVASITWTVSSGDPAAATITLDGLGNAVIEGLDGPANTTITLTATDRGDPDGCVAAPCDGAQSTSVTIDLEVIEPTIDLPPQVGEIVAPADPVAIDQAVSVSAPVSDEDDLTALTAVWDWGDGSTSNGLPSTVGTFTGSHLYDDPGVYRVTLTVTDSAGQSTAVEYNYVVIYDPFGGFVVGAGWIDSPEGACTLASCENLTGRIKFGFISRYRFGATEPSGRTRFIFRVGDLNFRSNDYQWLTVNDAEARYQGVGTINGSGSYGFTISVIDARFTDTTDKDLFRMKIWDTTTGEVVYDNQMGAELIDDPLQPISRGNIRVVTRRPCY